MIMLNCMLLSLMLATTYATIDVGQTLVGRVIHIESLRYRGSWLDAHHSYDAKITGCAERDVYYNSWTQFKVIKCESYVCLESVRYPNRYLDAHHSYYVKITETFYPNDKIWAQWRIDCTSEDLSVCSFYTPRYGIYLDAHHSKNAKITADYGIWSQFRILAPNPSDYFVTILSTENESGVDQTKTITMSEGVTDTTSTTTSITTTVSAEIGASFKVFSASASTSISSSWQRTSTQTFEKRTEISYTIVIPARTKIEFQQLTGTYGPFSIAAKSFKIKSQKLSGDSRRMDWDFKNRQNKGGNFRLDDGSLTLFNDYIENDISLEKIVEALMGDDNGKELGYVIDEANKVIRIMPN